MKVSKVTGYLLLGMILAAGILFFVGDNALAEDVTITTYYPAPYGVYDELRAKKMGIGDNWYDSATYPITDPTDLIVEGNVGIGTTGPNCKLQTNGAGVGADFLNNLLSTMGVHDSRSMAASVGGGIIFGGSYTGATQTTFAGIRGVKVNGTDSNYSGQLEFFTRNSGDNDWTGDQRMVIDNTGNVGIGTTDPGAKLHVAGDLKVDGSRIIRKSVVQVNSNNYSTTTAWALGPSFPTISDFKAGSLVKLSYHIPMRNDSATWGGGYIEPQISFNGGSTWNSLGSSGYDGAVMNNVSPSIGSYFNSILIDPSQGSDFSVTVRFYFRSYDGTVMINQSHNINIISGTATIMSGVNGTQHYAKIIVEELY